MLKYRNIASADLEATGDFIIEVFNSQTDEAFLLGKKERNGYTYEDQQD
jgi:hypothetical protein